MSAATAARDTLWINQNKPRVSYPIEAATSIYLNTIVCVDSASAHPGDAVPGATSTTLTCIGLAQSTQLNTTANGYGTAGALTIEILPCIAKLANSTSTDQIVQANVGQSCYIVDNQTVAATSGTSTRSIAGKVFFIDPDGSPWVALGVF